MRNLMHVVVIVCVLFSGCGNGPEAGIGFINETQHSDAQLWSLWKAAQKNLSQQIDLNPLQRHFSSVAADYVAGRFARFGCFTASVGSFITAGRHFCGFIRRNGY